MTGEQPREDTSDRSLPVKAQIESLLFVANEPVHIDQIARVLQLGLDEVERELETLKREYDLRGFRLQQRGLKWYAFTSNQ